MSVLLLRHGATRANDERIYCGHTDIPLSITGRHELAELRHDFIYPNAKDKLCISSGLLRADETLQVLFDRKPDIEDVSFREINFGRFEMHGYEELKTDPEYIAWITDETGDMPTPGGESRNAFKKRVTEAYYKLTDDSIVLCHGGVIAVIMQDLFPNQNRNFYEWQPRNGCGYEIRTQVDGITVFRAIPFKVSQEV